MNRKHAGLVLAFAVSFSSLASADGIQTDSDVRAMLAAQGYSGVTNLRRDGDDWVADANAAGVDRTLKLRIDANSGVVYPDEQGSELSPTDIMQSIQAAGYTNIGSVRFFGGVWKATATSSTMQSVEIKVDPADGHVIDESEQ